MGAVNVLPAFPAVARSPGFRGWVTVWVLALQRLGRGAQFHSHQLSWGPWGASPRLGCSVLCLGSTLPIGDGEETEGSSFPFMFIM